MHRRSKSIHSNVHLKKLKELLLLKDERVIDTWGYILNACQIFDLAEGSAYYSEEIERTMQAVTLLKSFDWEKGRHHDGYADSIESMLYLLPWYDNLDFQYWVDDEIEIMFQTQSPSGFVGEGYLDGNFIRTALLYAFYKTQGVVAEPWIEGLHIGASYDKNNDELYIYLSANAEWNGKLKFDQPRHRTIWNIPFEYPRLNGNPEWYVVEPQMKYSIINLNTGKESIHNGQSLIEGINVTQERLGAPINLKVIKLTETNN